MIGALIGSALSAASTIYGGIKASQAAKEAAKSVEEQRQKNQDWYDRRYNEDATQRADAQRVLQQTEESIKQRNRQAAGAAAVMGGSDEAAALAKQANNEALANATSQIVAQGEARKDSIESQYLAQDNSLAAQQQQIQREKAAAISQAVQGVGNVATKVAEAL